jgi:hypothetical protein
MRKQRIEYASPIDALVALAKRLSLYEERFHMGSEEFFDKFSKGQIGDELDFVEWSNDYQHYIMMKLELEKQLRHAA